MGRGEGERASVPRRIKLQGSTASEGLTFSIPNRLKSGPSSAARAASTAAPPCRGLEGPTLPEEPATALEVDEEALALLADWIHLNIVKRPPVEDVELEDYKKVGDGRKWGVVVGEREWLSGAVQSRSPLPFLPSQIFLSPRLPIYYCAELRIPILR